MRDGSLLVHKHLEGTLDDDEARELGERLATDPALSRLLAEMAYDQVQLREILEDVPAAAATATVHAGPRWSRGSLVAAASILLAVGVALFIGLRPRETPPRPVPEPVLPATGPKKKETPAYGFRGKVTGRVLRKTETPSVTLAVTEPAEFAGRKLTIVPGKKQNNDGEFLPDRDHVAFLRKAPMESPLTIDLRQLEGDDFSIAALTEEQIDWANQKIDRKKTEKPEKKPEPRKPPPREGDREGDK